MEGYDFLLHPRVFRSLDDGLLAFVHGVVDQRKGDFAGSFHVCADTFVNAAAMSIRSVCPLR